MQQANIYILLVEDQNFQRMMMVDILTAQGFNVTEAANGRIAWDILMSNKARFDVVLLDLVMPEMDGMELLDIMKSNPDTKDIPVVMMSAHNEREKISACLERGALDFLMKPVRRGTVLGLINQVMSQRKTQIEETEELEGLNAYEKIQELGRGTFGKVDLVRKKTTGELYAIKRIDFMFSNESERRSSENEASLLKVLSGPTIIKYFEQIHEENALNIVMEYASKGTLNETLDKLRKSGDRISTEQAIAWLSQVIIALMVLHSKHILHRDLKTQNLFLTENNIIKVGDFGISKALNHTGDLASTITGTAYVMAPEVCRGQVYGAKNDIWALGCILYEIMTLRKPFDEKDKHLLFEAILHKDYRPISEDIDSNIKMLISIMLNKDPERRPNVWELAKFPVISNYIHKFVEEHKCADIILPLFDHDPTVKLSNTSPTPRLELDEIASHVKGDLKLTNVGVGWFGKTLKNAFLGNDLMQLLQKKYGFTYEQVYGVCEELKDKGLIYNPSSEVGFNPSNYYQFREDIENLPRNMISIWSKEVRVPRDVTSFIINLCNSCIKKFNEDAQAIRRSIEFKQIVRSSAELERIEIKTLSRAERVETFIKIYQIMLFHYTVEEENTTAGWFSSPIDNFIYNIGGMNFNLKELKHGVLRGNQKPPYSYTRVFSKNDPRCLLPNFNDPRILFVCSDPPSSIKPLTNLNGRSEDLLRQKTEEYCNQEVCLNAATEELILPKVFNTYARDFGSTQEDVLRWIWQYFTVSKVPIQNVLDLLKNQQLNIHYRDS